MTSLSETYIQKIKRASATPQKLDFLISQLGLDSDPDSTCKDLLNRMDDSDYGITDWIDAIYFFYKYNAEVDFKFSTMLGFISCCEAAIQSDRQFCSLSDAVEDFLNEYGFENLGHS